MIPKKIYWLLGYNNLALILEQERKHWLLKTDKKKQLQDKKTGDLFQGQIDNTGCDIILESEKLPIKNDIIQLLTFANPAFDKILDIDYSAFTYSSQVNGLMFARITSINFPLTDNDGNETYKNYKLKLKNCEECIIPFGGSIDSSDVFVDKWIKTTTPPVIMILGDDGEYSIEKLIEFGPGITNITYYYPLTETLQPISISDDGLGNYTTGTINDNDLIGYPLFWFTSDQSNVGPSLIIENNYNDRNEQLMFIGNEGNSSKYRAKLYVGVDGNLNATPDGTETLNYVITCKCKEGKSFNNVTSDFETPVSPSSITMENKTTLQKYPLNIICSDKDVITLSKDIPWEYVDDETYSIDMSVFDSNCLSVSSSPITSIFDVHFDESVPFANESKDVGFAGIRAGSSNISSDVYPRYPHELNKWDGLPEWINNLEDGVVPQHLSIYAIHNTPTYSPDIPDSRQVAALLLDPGKIKTDDTYPELSNDERGRVYVLSNDEATYKNNANETYPKPARTVARICDVPTSVIQLSGISGLAPTSIVDKRYVRTEASYDENDKDRLYNTLASRWVKPISQDSSGISITERTNQSNDYVFDSLNLLEAVDLINHNDFREYINLNPKVDVQKVQLASITEPGSGYSVNDIGEIIVGGFAFNYTVTEIEDGGAVKNLIITPSSDYEINLSNFDMTDGNYGISEPYGTSPRTGDGTGLKFRFRIVDYSDIITSYGEILEELFAFVKFKDGLYLYSYIINKNSSSVPKMGKWEKMLKISEYEQSTITQSTGGLSSSEAYINSIIPSMKNIRVNLQKNNQDPVTLSALTTPTFINIIDKSKTPINPVSSDNDDKMVHVDMCKFYCDGINKLKANEKNVDAVIRALKANNVLKFDSYVIWKWDRPENTSDLNFTYGVIQRSFNNFLSTDYTTTLPVNDLNCDDYVHSNPGTTVVWDVNDFGVMMWTYNPIYQKHESYNINPETRELYIDKSDITWADIDIRDSRAGTQIKIVNNSNILAYNILTNNPIQATPLDPDMMKTDKPIYQQPNFVQIPELSIGNAVSAIKKEHQPMGNWQLVFPRIQSFKLTNITNGREFTPVQLQVLKGVNLGNIANVIDESGHNVNAKTLILDEVTEGVNAKVYNPESGNWDII